MIFTGCYALGRNFVLDLIPRQTLCFRKRSCRIIKASKTQETDRSESKIQNENKVVFSPPSLSPSQQSNDVTEDVIQNAMKLAYRRVLLELSSLPRAITVMFLIAVLSSLGTVIEQNESLDFYVQSYPDGTDKMLGFLTYPLLLFLQLDHIYTAPYFYGLIVLLVAQLMACTSTRQWPIAKAAQRWRFRKSPKSISQLENAEILPDANIRDLGLILNQKGYEIFLKDGSLYAFKNLVGRMAPIGVHIALLVTLAGISWGLLGGFKGALLIPEGNDIPIEQALIPKSPLALLPSGARNILHVDDFNVDYRSDGSIAQFYSDLSIINPLLGNTTYTQKISVNHPLRYGGITLYQTDWSMAAMNVTLESDAFEGGKTTVRLPMAILPERKDSAGRVFATFIPSPNKTEDTRTPTGVSVLAKDFQTVVLYDGQGQFSGVRRPGSGKSIEVDGMRITINDIIGSTGLEFKSDPGVPIVYAGFAGLMITTILSYLSHGQVWAAQCGRDLHVGGKSNRSQFLFNQELSEILDRVPDAGLNEES